MSKTMIYMLFALAFAMTGIAAFEFVCLKVTETANRKLKRKIAVLERSNCKLESDITVMMCQLEAAQQGTGNEFDESWPEVIVDEKRL